MDAFWTTIFAGLFVGIAAAALGLWQILSAPDRPNYPTSGRFKRLMMFACTVALAMRSATMLTGALDPKPVYVPQDTALAAFCLALLFSTFVVDHMRNWLPARTRARIQQLTAVAACRKRPRTVLAMTRAQGRAARVEAAVSAAAVEMLRADGVTAVGPNASVRAITGADR